MLQDVIIDPVGNLHRHGQEKPARAPSPPVPSRPRLPLDARRPSAEDIVSGGEVFEPQADFALGRAPTMRLAPEGMGAGDEEFEIGADDIA